MTARATRPRPGLRRRLALSGRLATGLLLAAGALVVPASMASATGPDTLPGLHTVGCAVDWRAESDLSLSLTKDYNNDQTITTDEVYSNRGYVYEVTSRDTYPLVQGPGELVLHHWINPNNTLGFRLPVATDYPMANVTVTITPSSPNFTLTDGLATLGLDRYVAIDGNPKYTVEAPAPTVTQTNGTIVLHWDYLPAGSANIFGFGGVTTGSDPQDPANHYLIGATLTGQYAEGAGCTPTAPPPPSVPEVGQCGFGLAGQSLMPLPGTDITVRDKFGTGGEVNADGWVTGTNRALRLYGATDIALTAVTVTATAAQGFTFDPATVGPVVTASAGGMGALYANGYTAAATGIGTPVVSVDGKTITLTIASMPAKSAVAFNVIAVPDGSLKQLVVHETLVGTKAGCTVTPSPEPTETPHPTHSHPTPPVDTDTPPAHTHGPGPTAPVATARPMQAATLASTGSNLIGLEVAGVGLLVAGTFLIGATRRAAKERKH